MSFVKEVLDLDIPVVLSWGVRDNGECKCPKGPACKSQGKHPVGYRWQIEGLIHNSADLEAAVAAEPGCNYSAATGHPMSDGRVLFVWDIDVDGDKAGAATMKELKSQGKTFPETRMTRTGGGGIHIWLAAPAGTEVNNAGGLFPGIDIRGIGGQVVIPPSVSNKGEYAELNNADIADAPQWLLDLLAERRADPEWVSAPASDIPSRTELSEEDLDRCDDIEEFTIYRICSELRQMKSLRPGQSLRWARGNSTWGLGTFVRAKDLMRLSNSPWSTLTPSQAAQHIRDWAPTDDSFTISQVEDLIARAAKEVSGIGVDVPPAPPVPRRDETDLGNGYRLWDHHTRRLLWVDKVGWYAYQSNLWGAMSDEAAQGLVQRMFEHMALSEGRWYSRMPARDQNGNLPEYDGTTGDSPRGAFRSWCYKQHDATRVRAAYGMAKGHTEHHEKLENFDVDDSIFNMKNGILKVKAREMLDHDPKYRTTMQIPHDYHEKAEAKKFKKLLEDMFPDINIRLAVQVMLGYSIFVNENPAKILPILIGEKDSGKTTLLEIVAEIMPTVSKTFEMSMLRAKRDGSPNPDLFDVLSARMVFTTEASGEWEIHGDFIKRLTGNDKMRARPNFARVTTEKRPSFTPWIATNQMPEILAADEAVKGRLKVAIAAKPKGKLNTELKNDIVRDEASGVVNWLLDGFDMYLAGDMPRLLEVLEEATEEAFTETNAYSRFLRDETIKIDGYLEPTDHIQAEWTRYEESARLNSTVSANKLGRELTGSGWKRLDGKHRVGGEDPEWVRVGRRLRRCATCTQQENLGKKKRMGALGLEDETFRISQLPENQPKGLGPVQKWPKSLVQEMGDE